MKSLDYKDSEDLKRTIDNLISSSNCFCKIEKNLRSNPEFMKFFNEATKEMQDNNCQSLATHYVITIRMMLEKIDDLKNVIDLLV